METRLVAFTSKKNLYKILFPLKNVACKTAVRATILSENFFLYSLDSFEPTVFFQIFMNGNVALYRFVRMKHFCRKDAQSELPVV